MRNVESVVDRALRQIGNLDRVEQRLNEDPKSLLGPLRATLDGGHPEPEGFETRPLGSRGARNGPGDEESASHARERLLDSGRRAIAKVKKDGRSAQLDESERMGLEAIILVTGRPALLIQNGKFFPPPDDWRMLEAERSKIESVLPRVGRIELTGHPNYEWVGTGFLVADDVIMTNRHVAQEFCREDRTTRKWTFSPGIRARVDYNEELGATAPVEFTLTGVIGVHDVYDMALLRMRRKDASGREAPAPLPITADPARAKSGRRVYVVGYPASDSRRNDPEVMRRIFASVYDVKRLQPGELTSVSSRRAELNHDCSTLGGNSGSCVVDLEKHEVVGLHFGGRYGERNYAVLLGKLTRDPLVKKAAINFV